MTAGEALPVAVRAAGCRIETADGRSYLDACGGAMVMLLGHCHPRVVEALARQSQQLNYTYRFSFRNDPMLELAERIAGHAPGDLEWSFFNSSGSEANESAMHLAVLYWELMGKPAKIEFLSRVTSYHGSTWEPCRCRARAGAPPSSHCCTSTRPSPTPRPPSRAPPSWRPRSSAVALTTSPHSSSSR